MAIADNIWWTRKARIETEKRLLYNALCAQFLLLWYSFISVSASVYYLKFNAQSEYASVAWVIFSVLVLCVSSAISGLSYKERASLVKDSYESLNSLYLKVRKEEVGEDQITKEYEQILNLCENHTDIDYYNALCHAYLTLNFPRDSEKGLDRWPTKYVWWLVIQRSIVKFLSILLLFALPVLIFAAVEIASVS
jgi:hypothetical protein